MTRQAVVDTPSAWRRTSRSGAPTPTATGWVRDQIGEVTVSGDNVMAVLVAD
jgi:hypothetical protein